MVVERIKLSVTIRYVGNKQLSLIRHVNISE